MTSATTTTWRCDICGFAVDAPNGGRKPPKRWRLTADPFGMEMLYCPACVARRLPATRRITA